MFTFREYINSPVIVEGSVDEEYAELVTLIKSKYSDAWKTGTEDGKWLYRGINTHFQFREFTKQHSRVPKADPMVSRLVSILPSWKGYPSRLTNVHICGTVMYTIHDMLRPGNLYIVLPKNGTKLAILPVADWNDDPVRLWPRLKLELDELIGALASMTGWDYSQMTDWDRKVKRQNTYSDVEDPENLVEFKNKVNELQASLNKIKGSDEKVEFLERALDAYKGEKRFIEIIEQHKWEIWNALNWAFDPASAKIKLATTKTFDDWLQDEEANEVWFNGDALYISTKRADGKKWEFGSSDFSLIEKLKELMKE